MKIAAPNFVLRNTTCIGYFYRMLGGKNSLDLREKTKLNQLMRCCHINICKPISIQVAFLINLLCNNKLSSVLNNLGPKIRVFPKLG